MLRQDLLQELSSTRRELGEQLVLVRTMMEAAQAAKAAGAKSSRAVGAANEEATLAMLHDIVTGAGDLFEATGGQAGAGGTTHRTGDGVATLSPAITGAGRQVRIVLEAKHRSRAMTAKNLRDEISTGCRIREAAGGLVVVPTRAEVPGGGSFLRLGTTSYVVCAEDPEAVSLIYLLLREQIAVLTVRQDDSTEIDLTALEARLKLALEGLTEFDEVGRLAGQAHKTLERLIDIGGKARLKVRENLTHGITMLQA